MGYVLKHAGELVVRINGKKTIKKLHKRNDFRCRVDKLQIVEEDTGG